MKQHGKDILDMNTQELDFSQFNYLAVQLLDKVGITDPSQQQIDIIENIITVCGIQVRLGFNKVLNKKEIACLYLAANGNSSQQTAEILSISQSSVESHRKSIKNKLKCKTIAHAVFEGIRFGLL